jgi:hypothetical protein
VNTPDLLARLLRACSRCLSRAKRASAGSSGSTWSVVLVLSRVGEDGLDRESRVDALGKLR